MTVFIFYLEQVCVRIVGVTPEYDSVLRKQRVYHVVVFFELLEDLYEELVLSQRQLDTVRIVAVNVLWHSAAKLDRVH